MSSNNNYFLHDASLEDTDRHTRNFIYQLLRTLSPEERYRRLARLCSFGATAIKASIKESYPHCSEEELRALYAARLHGAEFARKYLDIDVEKITRD